MSWQELITRFTIDGMFRAILTLGERLFMRGAGSTVEPPFHLPCTCTCACMSEVSCIMYDDGAGTWRCR
jgi:hypothetical protein